MARQEMERESMPLVQPDIKRCRSKSRHPRACPEDLPVRIKQLKRLTYFHPVDVADARDKPEHDEIVVLRTLSVVRKERDKARPFAPPAAQAVFGTARTSAARSA
jgi:hypothetical protein